MSRQRGKLVDRLRDGLPTVEKIVYPKTGPTIEEWAKEQHGKFAHVLKRELRRDPNTGELCVWAFLRTNDDWEKWSRVDDNVIYTQPEYNDMVREFQCKNQESSQSDSIAPSAIEFFRRVISPSGI